MRTLKVLINMPHVFKKVEENMKDYSVTSRNGEYNISM